MNVQELPAKAFLSHLRRHPIPEIMDEACEAALSAVLKEYGDTITHGAGLEVRLGEEARYVDYIMAIDHDDIPHIHFLWFELDYGEIRKAQETGTKITPCLFANTDFGEGSREKWDEFLPAFLGEERARCLRPAFDRVLRNLPEGAYPKQVGTMTGRGELHIMRLVILFPDWDSIPEGLVAIGWQGDPDALRKALLPWRETNSIAVNIDLGEKGVLPKIGIEVFSRWRHPLIVDKAIARLEAAGLCLPSKAEALRRWIRIRPDGDPFIQTLIAYFKLNYKDGEITEAKAYLEQSPYIHHHYFDAYERPVYVEIMVKDKQHTLPIGTALQWLYECEANRVGQVRITGDVTKYRHLDRILEECKVQSCDEGKKIRAVVELAGGASAAWLEKAIEAGADSFIIDIQGDDDDKAVLTLKNLRDIGVKKVVARWLMHSGNADKLLKVIQCTEELGLRELIVTGMKPGQEVKAPTREQLTQAAAIIKKWRSGHHVGEGREESAELPVGQEIMELTVDSCFSQLRAFMEGRDPKKNGNRGIERGCTAGRDHFCLLPSGKVTPCLYLNCLEEWGSLATYWEESPALKKLRDNSGCAEGCKACVYRRRCLPCPAVQEKIAFCPVRAE
ncbi:hypothetical protein [Selenomonas sp. AB3002]|uniref:hypothetical protein n=1 Tax=Selenomonas sp. AB3002 TaxID=1392502 RepID=UPI000495F14F